MNVPPYPNRKTQRKGKSKHPVGGLVLPQVKEHSATGDKTNAYTVRRWGTFPACSYVLFVLLSGVMYATNLDGFLTPCPHNPQLLQTWMRWQEGSTQARERPPSQKGRENNKNTEKYIQGFLKILFYK